LKINVIIKIVISNLIILKKKEMNLVTFVQRYFVQIVMFIVIIVQNCFVNIVLN